MGMNKKPEPTPAQPGLLEQLGGLDIEKIQSLLSMVQKSDQVDDFDEPETDNDIINTITNIANNNPELVQKFLSNLKTGENQDNNQQYLGG